MIGTIIFTIISVVYGAGVALMFAQILIINSVGRAFGWPSSSLTEAIVVSLLWPLVLPAGLLWGLWENWRDK